MPLSGITVIDCGQVVAGTDAEMEKLKAEGVT